MSMSLDKTAQEAVNSISALLSGYGLSDPEKLDILKIVESSLIKTVEETTADNLKAASICCGHEADLAHKIQEEMNRKRDALISNLMALR